MAQLLVRSGILNKLSKIPKQLSSVATRSYANEANPEDYGAYPDPIEHAVGLEKKMLLARLAGDDRYEPKVYKLGPGTSDYPNLVPVTGDARLVACICEPDQAYLNYFYVKKGYPTRCECGYWFKAVDGDPDAF